MLTIFISVLFLWGANAAELKKASSNACLSCTSVCSLVPPQRSAKPCYQGAPADANYCYDNDPVVQGFTYNCNTCPENGFMYYRMNDPIFTTIELWFNSSHAKGSVKNAEQESAKVPVEAYVESKCPYCIGFITGALQSVMNLPDIVAIIDLKIVPYGNTKFNETTNIYTCQHGVDECSSDVLELCTEYHISGDIGSISTGATSLQAWPFILCMANAQGNPALGKDCFAKSNMEANTGVSWETIEKCSASESDAVQAAGRAATPSNHQYVPWVLVDGLLLEDPDTTLLSSICSAYTGPEPASCAVNRKNKRVSHNV